MFQVCELALLIMTYNRTEFIIYVVTPSCKMISIFIILLFCLSYLALILWGKNLPPSAQNVIM
jgi:phosphoglycerol transferase MdoB-like AlkP superfamily enzyme